LSSVKFTDRSPEVRRALEKALELGLETIGMVAETHAKEAITRQGAVDTGRLRNSITYAVKKREGEIVAYRDDEGAGYEQAIGYGVKKDEVYIGTNVEYAPYVELGTRKMRARPFLKPAATEHNDEYKQIMEATLKSAEE
jgi:HK97 gp10 family phage protein